MDKLVHFYYEWTSCCLYVKSLTVNDKEDIPFARGWDYSSCRMSEVHNSAEKLVNIVRSLGRGTALCAAARVRGINQRCLRETGASWRNFSHFASCPVNNTGARGLRARTFEQPPSSPSTVCPSSSSSQLPRMQLLFFLPAVLSFMVRRHTPALGTAL